jgi:putative ABC transport system substrate-binding protein
MEESGWIEGRNVRFDARFGGGDLGKISTAADELVALSPELIYAAGLPSVQALCQRTRKVPVVLSLVADPVGFGAAEPSIAKIGRAPRRPPQHRLRWATASPRP